jgi:hypothetical protein
MQWIAAMDGIALNIIQEVLLVTKISYKDETFWIRKKFYQRIMVDSHI